jgi:lipopolysaccharide transport system permease protein
MSTDIAPLARSGVLEFHGAQPFAVRNRLAWQDIVDGIRLFPLAWKLGWLDIRLRYRGSMLGPFWLTISTGVMVGALGYLYAGIFKTDVHDYLPFLALSLVLWGFLGTMAGEACTVFTESEAILRSTRMPYSLCGLRAAVRNVLVLAHNVVVIVIVYLVFQVWPGWDALLALPALVVWIVDALALTLLVGAFCARFRDVQPIINSVMQIAFFVTPIIWKPEQLGHGARLLPLNPFFDLLEILRAPLLGQLVAENVWLGAVLYSMLLCCIAWLFFVRARSRIAFWI